MHGALPNETDAEAAVISSMVLDASSIDKVIMHGFRAEHCYADANRYIIETIYELHKDGGVVDPVTIATKLRDKDRLSSVGGTPYIVSVIDATPAVANVLEHASIVMEKWRVRSAIKLCQEAAAKGYGPIENAQEYLESIELGIADLAHQEKRIQLESVGSIAQRIVSDIDDASRNPEARTTVKTGITELDRMMGGGLMRGNVYVVGARPGMGKTAFATTIARNVSEPVRAPDGTRFYDAATAFFSLEMPRDMIGARFLVQDSKIPIGEILAQNVSKGNFTKLVDAASRLVHLPLFIDDTPAITIAEVTASVRTLKRRIRSGQVPVKRLGLVAIDYLQLMRGIARKGGSREEEVASLSRGLKELAKQEDVPVLALAQLNRKVETKGKKDRRPELADLRESGAIEQDADAVLFLYREGYYDKESNQRTGEIILAKQRNGPTGSVEAAYNAPEMRFYNLAPVPEAQDAFNEFDNYHWDDER